MFKLQKKYIAVKVAILILLIMFTIKIFDSIRRTRALKHSILLNGQVEKIEHTRGSTFFDVRYQFNGKTIHNSFGTGNREIVDSLQINSPILLKVSIDYPNTYIEYIGENTR